MNEQMNELQKLVYTCVDELEELNIEFTANLPSDWRSRIKVLLGTTSKTIMAECTYNFDTGKYSIALFTIPIEEHWKNENGYDGYMSLTPKTKKDLVMFLIIHELAHLALFIQEDFNSNHGHSEEWQQQYQIMLFDYFRAVYNMGA